QDAARARGVELSIHPVTSTDAIVPAINAARAAGAGGLNLLAASVFGGNYKAIIAHTRALRLPAIYQLPDYVELGALIGYGPVQTQVYRQVARILAKVPRGALLTWRAAQLTQLAAFNRLPATYSNREYVDVGGLMSYGTSVSDGLRQVGVYA